MYAHFNEPPPRLSGSTPGVPSAMDAVVARALAKQRHDRFASCGELARAARAALTAPVAHAEYATATAKAPPSRTAPRQRGVPRRLRWVVGVVALAAAGAAATLLFPRSGGVQGGVATATYQQTDHKLFRVALRRGADPENVGRSLESRSKGADDWINISADGRSLLLSTERFGCAGYACIVLADHGLRNPEVVRVDGEAQHARFGAVSSRTNLIVTESTDGPHVTDLWTLRRSGRSWSKPVLLTSASPHKWNAFPALTGDAGRVAFECGPDPSESLDSSICEVGTDGSGLRVLLTPARRPPGVEAGSYALTHPSYGPRGELFFESDWGTPGDQVWRLPAGSHDPVRITTEGHHYAPCVLSDGRVVALRSTQSGGTDEHEIVVMRADGSKPVVIATVSGVLETVLGCSG
jgi:hypothetical protein